MVESMYYREMAQAEKTIIAVSDFINRFKVRRGAMPYKMEGEKHAYSKALIPPSYLERLTPILSGLPTDAIIADIGAGTCEIARYAGTLGFQRVLNFDLYPDGLREATQKVPSLTAFQASGNHLPLRDESVDLIHAKDMIVHVEDKAALFGEFARVLKPNGYLFLAAALTTNNPPNYYATFPATTALLIEQSGFSLVGGIKRWKPLPEERSKDWYKKGNVARDVFLARKGK